MKRNRSWRTWLILIVLAGVVGYQYLHGQRTPSPGTTQVSSTQSPDNSRHDADQASRLPAFLPPEAHEVLSRIASRGPFPYRQDGTVFGNREHLLPEKPRGYYHEYTVPTPGARTRGARRIVTGGNPPSEYYYTGDHYRSFQRFTLPR